MCVRFITRMVPNSYAFFVLQLLFYTYVNGYECYLIIVMDHYCRSQWPRGLRRRSAAARLLRSWVRIPPAAWMFVVSAVCCHIEVSVTS